MLVCAGIGLGPLFISRALSSQQTAALHGEVIDAVTHRPIARVLVESPVGGDAMLTDNAGRFSFENIAPGTMQLRYHRPGYFDPLSGQPQASQSVTVATDTPEQTLQLSPAAAIHGQVQLPDGESPAGFRIGLYAEQVTDGRRHWQIQQNATTRSDGSFSFQSLAPGSFLLHAEASLDPAPGNAPPAIRSGYAPVWAPETSDIRAATIVSPGPGQTAEVRMQLNRVPFYPVAVRVTGDSRARFFQITGNGFVNWNYRFQPGGETLITELPNGSYLLSAGGRGQANASELRFHVDGAPVSGLSIAVQDQGGGQGNGAGRDQDLPGGPNEPPKLNVLSFLPVDAPDQPVLSQSVLFDTASGTGTLRQPLPPGQYWVSAPGVSLGYLTALSSGGVDLLTNQLSVAPGTQPVFAAGFGQGGGAIAVVREGAVKNQPCVVQIIPLSPGGEAMLRFATDPTTPMSFGNLVPGDYLVVATGFRQNIAFREPGVLAQLTGTRVTVTAGATVQASVSTLLNRLPAAGATP